MAQSDEEGNFGGTKQGRTTRSQTAAENDESEDDNVEMESEDVSKRTKRRPTTRSQTATENENTIELPWTKQKGQEWLMDIQSSESEDDDGRSSIPNIDLDIDESSASASASGSAWDGTRSLQNQQVSILYKVVIITTMLDIKQQLVYLYI